jgi:hypothetical protein
MAYMQRKNSMRFVIRSESVMSHRVSSDPELGVSRTAF